MLTDDFTFSSPLDDHIDKKVYLERCWPNSQHIRAFTIEHSSVPFDAGSGKASLALKP